MRISFLYYFRFYSIMLKWLRPLSQIALPQISHFWLNAISLIFHHDQKCRSIEICVIQLHWRSVMLTRIVRYVENSKSMQVQWTRNYKLRELFLVVGLPFSLFANTIQAACGSSRLTEWWRIIYAKISSDDRGICPTATIIGWNNLHVLSRRVPIRMTLNKILTIGMNH